MISVLTITYQRHHLLEEAIQSFLRNFQEGDEMVVINDSPDVKYIYDHPNVKIINTEFRFPSISKKLEWGYKQCQNNYIYRLDDDDLLGPNSLGIVKNGVNIDADYDIYRSDSHYFFVNNKFEKLSDNINNGNVYSKKYLDGIKFPDKSGDEDVDITFHHNAKIFTLKFPTMIYRWGMNTYHISGWGKQSSDTILNNTDKLIRTKERGEIILNPHFKEDYYKQLIS
jgi:glycosyltransferase involved in cell wall biosynthesis